MRTHNAMSNGATNADHGKKRIVHLLAAAKAQAGNHIANSVHQPQRPLLRYQCKARKGGFSPHPTDEEL